MSDLCSAMEMWHGDEDIFIDDENDYCDSSEYDEYDEYNE